MVLVCVAAALAFVGAGGEDSNAPDPSPRIVSVAEILDLEASLGHPLYWAGPRRERDLELTRAMDGSIYLRYVPAGTGAGRVAGSPTIGTYPVPGAQAAVRRAARQAEAPVTAAASGAIVLADPQAPGSVYLAYPGSDLQIEVYDPVPGRAMELIRSGRIRPVGEE